MMKRWRWNVLFLALVLLLAGGTVSGLAETSPWHILLLGFDDWETPGSTRTDMNIIMTLDSKHSRLTLVSLVRDTCVTTPNGRLAKLNTLVRTGGYQHMLDTIALNYEVKIEQYLAFGMKDVQEMVDAMGGLEITLTREEASNEKMKDVAGVKGAGTYLLDGYGVVQYARIRSGTQKSDFGRVERHQTIFRQLEKALQEMGPMQTLALAQVVLSSIDTNMSTEELAALALSLYELRGVEIEALTLPIEKTFQYSTLDGSSAIELNWTKNLAALEAFWAQ